MTRLHLAFLSALALIAVACAPVLAQDGTTDGVQDGKFGIGFSSAYPSYGISGAYYHNEYLTGSVVVGALGTVTAYGGRVWYRFLRDVPYDVYAYGGLAAYRVDVVFASETAIGYGAGAGIEASLKQLFNSEDFPPIFVNAEVGFAGANWDTYSGFSALAVGVGAHFRFGKR